MSKLSRRLNHYLGKFELSGLIVGGLFAVLSLTPSLLPRGWVIQGALTGIAFAFGYGIGILGTRTYKYLELPEPNQPTKNVFREFIKIAGPLLLLWALLNSQTWNNRVREIVGLDKTSSSHFIGVLLVAALVAILLIALSRLVQTAFIKVRKPIAKRLPAKYGRILGATIGLLVIVFIVNGVLNNIIMSGVNSAFSLRDGSTDPGVTQPESPLRSGSADSLINWETLGRQGRKFTGLGPTPSDIANFSGKDAMQPIRVYVGLKSAESIEDRAQLALDELIRTKAFDRKVLVVTTTTGTGWLDPEAMDTVEYIHNGNTAIVGLQYSYLPSWISLFVDQQITKDTARATLNAIHDYWSSLDEKSRPKLYLFGLSLGSYGSQYSAQDLRLVNDPIDGALWAGTPFLTDEWQALINNRDEGSPAWRPIVDEGRVVRFTGEQNELSLPSAKWGKVKFAYLQHATDPVVFFSPGLIFNSPDWLKEGQRGPDVTPDMDWYPGVTFWQVAADMPMATSIATGHGHSYSPSSYIDVWAAITAPNNWDQTKANKLKSIFESE